MSWRCCAMELCVIPQANCPVSFEADRCTVAPGIQVRGGMQNRYAAPIRAFAFSARDRSVTPAAPACPPERASSRGSLAWTNQLGSRTRLRENDGTSGCPVRQSVCLTMEQNLAKIRFMSRPSVGQDVFGALAHPIRRKIIVRLARRPLSVTEIGQPFSCAGATLTHHLQILRQVGLVRSTRKGTSIIYELQPKGLRKLRDWIKSLDSHLKS